MSYLPSPPYSEGSSTAEGQALKRRAVQNDSSTRSDLPLMFDSNLAREGCTYERYRVGGPPLQLLPLSNTTLDHSDPAAVALRQLLPRIIAIMREHQVELDDGEDTYGSSNNIEFVHRTVNDEPPSLQNLTILIPAIWNERAPFQWLHVVDELRGLLVHDVRTRPVKVELIGGPHLRQQLIDVVEENHPIVAAWHTVGPEVLSIITGSAHLRNQWWALGVRRIGRQNWDGEAPLSTIVSILVNWDVKPVHWVESQNLIKNVLHSYNLHDVDVVFSRGEISRNVFPLQDLSKPPELEDIIGDEYSETIGMGSDFGPAKYFEKAPGQSFHGPYGTLGGYLKVTDQRTQEVTRMGLTNYHTIRPAVEGFGLKVGPGNAAVPVDVPPGSDLDALDRNGMEPDFAKRQAMVLESPSRRKHNFTLYGLKNDMVEDTQELGATDPQVLRLQRQFDQKKRFFDEGKHLFGRPWAASGFCRRTDDNHRLDWALIEFTMPNRLGSNITPSANEWPMPNAVPIKLNGQPLKGLGSCDDPIDRRNVYKKGARTGLTHGRFSCIKDNICMKSDDERLNLEVSSEYVFISRSGHDKPFAWQGDSGSMVFTRLAKFIGLLWGGHVGGVQSASTEIYVTDAATLLQHLNAYFHGRYTFELFEG